MKIKISCDYCSKEFERDKKHVNYSIKHGYKQFCSKECLVTVKNASKQIPCSNCGKLVKKLPSDIKTSITGNVYCSRSCATSKNNTLFKSGSSNPNYLTGLGSYRSKALNHYGSKCEICNYSTEQCLEVHHIDGNRSNNNLENLIVLCPTHHREVHFGITKIRE